jgi:hypothetical protein
MVNLLTQRREEGKGAKDKEAKLFLFFVLSLPLPLCVNSFETQQRHS